jgi:hypothetical protein
MVTGRTFKRQIFFEKKVSSSGSAGAYLWHACSGAARPSSLQSTEAMLRGVHSA